MILFFILYSYFGKSESLTFLVAKMNLLNVQFADASQLQLTTKQYDLHVELLISKSEYYSQTNYLTLLPFHS